MENIMMNRNYFENSLDFSYDNISKLVLSFYDVLIVISIQF